MRKQITVLLVFLLSVISLANISSYDIRKIEIINNREVPYEVILNSMKSKEGQKYATENMIADYKAIKDLDYVSDVSIYPTVYDNGIKLTVDITEKKDAKALLEEKGIIPLTEREKVDTTIVVSSIEIIGNTHVTTKEIRDMIPIQTGGYFSRNRVIEGHKNLIESGYFRDVIPDVIKTGKGVKIVYSVLENPIINGINIIGNTVYTTDELMQVIQTEPGKIFNINTIRKNGTTIYFCKNCKLDNM